VPDALPRRTGFLDRDGERLYWESVGAGPPLVLCHGAGGNHAVWWQQVPFFARDRQVVTWDHRGFGRSTDRAGRLAPAVAADDLAALLDRLGLARVDLVGQSMGGWTALGLALASPQRVGRLVLADTPGGIDVPDLAALAARAREGAPLAPPDRMGLHPALDAALLARDPARAYLYQMLGGFGEPDLARMAGRLLACVVPDADLARLACSVLFVVGERDPLFPPAAIRAAAAKLRDAHVVVLPGAGHSPYFETPDAWNEAVSAFLAPR
jgi:pimeloyl-ACP methyl ester carboxylesterase